MAPNLSCRYSLSLCKGTLCLNQEYILTRGKGLIHTLYKIIAKLSASETSQMALPQTVCHAHQVTKNGDILIFLVTKREGHFLKSNGTTVPLSLKQHLSPLFRLNSLAAKTGGMSPTSDIYCPTFFQREEEIY